MLNVLSASRVSFTWDYRPGLESPGWDPISPVSSAHHRVMYTCALSKACKVNVVAGSATFGHAIDIILYNYIDTIVEYIERITLMDTCVVNANYTRTCSTLSCVFHLMEQFPGVMLHASLEGIITLTPLNPRHTHTPPHHTHTSPNSKHTHICTHKRFGLSCRHGVKPPLTHSHVGPQYSSVSSGVALITP